MAKDVDLSSKEWCNIVFEGKNKEFGAYQLRDGSIKRHNRSVIIVLCVLAVILGLLVMVMKGVFASADEDQTAINTIQEEIGQYESEEEEEQQEEEQFEIPEPEVEEIFKEDVANETRVTDILIVDDKDYEEDKAVKDQSELQETETQFGTKDVTDGVDDRTKERIVDQVIVDKPVEPKDDIVYTTANVQQQPEFPGGEAAMYKWLNDHIQYPAAASEEGVSGRVVIEFIVSKTGAIENAKVVRGRHPALDKEALRVVKAMPKWNPGRNNGQAVKVTYHLPVTFRLQQ